MKVVVFTLGCKVNECESDSLISALIDKGYEVSDKLEVADIYIVNTCAVTKEAEKKSRQMSARIKKLNPNAKIIFTGCACEKNSKPFISKDESSLVTGVFGKGNIPDMLDKKGVNIYPQTKVFEELARVKTFRERAYIKVQDGCDSFCAYCTIPYLRGRSRSRDPKEVVNEIMAINPKEAVINGINLSSYNFNGLGLSGLMGELKDVNCRIRLGSLEVRVIDRDFLQALKELKDFAPHFHLSLQSGSDEVLRKMNRHYTADEYAKKVDLIREYFPYAGITTDIIAGFPTETEDNFNETLALIDRVKFSDIHPFIFSPREGTVAYKMKDLDYSIKKERLDKLLEKKAQCKRAFALLMKGREEEFLFEYNKDGYGEGYAGNYLRLYIKDLKETGFKKVVVLDEYLDGATAKIKE